MLLLYSAAKSLRCHDRQIDLADDRGAGMSIRITARKPIFRDGTIMHVTHQSDFVPGGFPLAIGNGVTVGHQAILHACQMATTA